MLLNIKILPIYSLGKLEKFNLAEEDIFTTKNINFGDKTECQKSKPLVKSRKSVIWKIKKNQL